MRFYVSSFLKIGKFGKSDSDLLSQAVVEGNLFEQLDAALKILFTRFINSSISYDGIQRIKTYEYPYEAVREILLNAFTHRTYENSPIQISVYDDHIMFWNQELYEVFDRTALRHLDELVKLNVLIKVGEKKGTRYEIKH